MYWVINHLNAKLFQYLNASWKNAEIQKLKQVNKNNSPLCVQMKPMGNSDDILLTFSLNYLIPKLPLQQGALVTYQTMLMVVDLMLAILYSCIQNVLRNIKHLVCSVGVFSLHLWNPRTTLHIAPCLIFGLNALLLKIVCLYGHENIMQNLGHFLGLYVICCHFSKLRVTILYLLLRPAGSKNNSFIKWHKSNITSYNCCNIIKHSKVIMLWI